MPVGACRPAEREAGKAEPELRETATSDLVPSDEQYRQSSRRGCSPVGSQTATSSRLSHVPMQENLLESFHLTTAHACKAFAGPIQRARNFGAGDVAPNRIKNRVHDSRCRGPFWTLSPDPGEGITNDPSVMGSLPGNGFRLLEDGAYHAALQIPMSRTKKIRHADRRQIGKRVAARNNRSEHRDVVRPRDKSRLKRELEHRLRPNA